MLLLTCSCFCFVLFCFFLGGGGGVGTFVWFKMVPEVSGVRVLALRLMQFLFKMTKAIEALLPNLFPVYALPPAVKALQRRQ